jgi:hypothetical protein
MFNSNDPLTHIKEELKDLHPDDIPAVVEYVHVVKNVHTWQPVRIDMLDKLSRIKKPHHRMLISALLNFLIFISPMCQDDDVHAWEEANRMFRIARARAADFLRSFLRYPSQYYRVVKFNSVHAAWLRTFMLYRVAIRRTSKAFITWVIPGHVG